jgi:glycosyltransferase involved in cell wall biosynthesis
LVTIPDVTSYSPERLHYRIGGVLQDRFDVTLVGTEIASDRLCERFERRTYYQRQLPGPLQTLLLLPLTLLSVLRFTAEEEPSVLASIGNLYVNGLSCALVGSLTGTPSVVRVTSDLFAIYRYQETRRARLRTFVQNNILGRVAVHLADRVITLGPVMKGKLEAEHVHQDRLCTVPQPILFDDEAVSTESDGLRDRFGVAEDARVVLFVGYFSRVKGPRRLVRTVEYIRRRAPEVEFVLVGSGGAHEGWVRDSLADDNKVHFAGWVEHSELTAFYRAADVLLHPSNSEGLPNVVLEALLNDLPVVATDSGGEVPVHVSNIGRDCADLGEFLLSPETLVQDPLRPDVRPERNRDQYLSLFTECVELT